MILLITLLLIVVITGLYALYKIMYTKHIKDEDVYSCSRRMEKYGIKDISNPCTYGLDYKEVEFYSGKKRLTAWYVPGKDKNSDKAMVLIHGRGTNRLILLEYLKLIKSKAYNEEYSVLLVNMRNSGASDKGLTKLGFVYSEDIYSSVKYIRNNYNKKSFVLYGFSMGALGSVLAVYRYKHKFQNMDVTIEKMILDSPLSNSREMILKAAGDKFYTRHFRIIAPIAFNFVVKGKLYKLKLGYLLQKTDIKTLILQSVEDKKTPYEILKKELMELKGKNNIFLHLFTKGKHVLVYRDNKEEYAETVDIFLRN